jgi:superfamily II DNA or RNA helicase
VVCINSANKITDHYDLLIVDEAHRSLSPQFRKMYDSISYDYLLTLTATLPNNPEYKEFLHSVSPIVYTKTVEDALEADAISPFRIYNLEIGMDKKSESKYKAFNQMFMEANLKLFRLKKQLGLEGSPFDIAKQYSNSEEDSELVKTSKKFWGGMTLRKRVLYENLEKVKIAVQIVRKFPDLKWIVFFKTIKQAELFASHTGAYIYHSEMNSLERKTVLDSYSASKVGIMSCVDALGEGVDISNIDAGILASGTSVPLSFIQNLGRVTRKKEGKQALFINLHTKDTNEKTWVTSRI